MGKIRFNKVELYFFLIFSVISILSFWLVKYIPSLDGPQHLYNARLIEELIKGNDFISKFFRFNPVIVGNMSSLYIMAFLMLVFPAWLAEKIFLSFYVIGLALSFRYFIRSINKTDSLLYLLIFPFAFTSLFMLGYYNYCVAFIPFFITLGYLKRNESHLSIRVAVWLTVLILLIYLSHAVVFVFFGFVIFIQMIFDLAYPIFLQRGDMKGITVTSKKYLLILVTSVPAIILWCLYYSNLSSGDPNISNVSFRPISNVLEDLYKLRILVGFHHEAETGPNTIMIWTLAALVILSIIPMHRYFPRQFKPVKRNNTDWFKWTFVAIILFFITIFFPDRMVTGSMSARICILFFFGVITWISLQLLPKKIMIIGLLLIMGAFTWHRAIILQYYRDINKDIADVEKVGESIKSQSILYPIDCSESWFQPHFHCYLGVDKLIVDLKNPQVSGAMPLLWNYSKMPNILLGELNQTESGVNWDTGDIYLTPVSMDYIFIWKPQLIEDNDEVSTLLSKVTPYYNMVSWSASANAVLYQLNHQNQH